MCSTMLVMLKIIFDAARLFVKQYETIGEAQEKKCWGDYGVQ